jgi:hypothetical protein
MTSKQLIQLLTATTVITVGAAIAYALPQQSYPLYETPQLQQLRPAYVQPTYVQPNYTQPRYTQPKHARPIHTLPPATQSQAAKKLSAAPGTYGFHTTPKIPTIANLLSNETDAAKNSRVIVAQLEAGELANRNSPPAKTVSTAIVSEYDVAPDLDATMMGNASPELALPEPSPLSSIANLTEEVNADANIDDSYPDLDAEPLGDAVEEPICDATDSELIEEADINADDNQLIADPIAEAEFDTLGATTEPGVADSDAGIAQIEASQVEAKLSEAVEPREVDSQEVDSSAIESNPVHSIDPPWGDASAIALPSVVESSNSFSRATATPSPTESTPSAFGKFRRINENENWEPPLTVNPNDMLRSPVVPLVQSNPFFQSNQWSPPLTATTPGHNEMVPMNSKLSLSPPAQPGAAVQSYLPVQPPAFAMSEYIPNFDPQVGHRHPMPIDRAKVYPLDDGEKFDFENKKRDFPPFNEIIATGRFFYMAEVLWAEPQFQGNTAIATEATNFGESIPLDFDSDFHPRIRLGFESQYGPGIELTYFNINSNSEIASFTSDGAVTGHTNAWVIGRNVWSRILADDPGEILSTQHSIDIDSGVVSFFKELKFPISRVNGNFGFQYVSIAQRLNANVVAADGVTVESLSSVSDMRAYGPRAVLEYYRPIGHTPMELVTTFGGAVLFGQRDQVVTNSQTGLENRLGADEFLTILDFLVAVQYTKTVGENRSVYGRFGFMNQTWIGGGTAAFPQGDFGLRGLTFGIGYNR